MPTVFEFSKRNEVQSQQKVARYHRLLKRQCKAEDADDSTEISMNQAGVNAQSVQMVDKATCMDTIQNVDKATSTDYELNHGATTGTHKDLRKTCEKLEQQTVVLKKELLMAKSPSANLNENDKQTHSYTGLPSYAVFTSLVGLLSTVMSTHCAASSLSLPDQFLLF